MLCNNSAPPASSRFATLATRRVDCLGTQYMALQLGSMFMIVVFVFGVPFFWLVSLFRVRKSLHRTGPEGQPTMAAQEFDFLIGAYKPKFYLVSARSVASVLRRALVRACVCLRPSFSCAPHACFASHRSGRLQKCGGRSACNNHRHPTLAAEEAAAHDAICRPRP